MDAVAQAHFLRATMLRSHHCAVAMTAFTVLYTACVLAQAVQFMQPTSLLPAFAEFQITPLPYAILLPVQLAIVVAMSGATLAVNSGQLAPQPARGQRLLTFGALYVAGSLLRLLLGLTLASAPGWCQAWLPTCLHLLLAAFVLVLAAFHLRQA